MKLLFDSNIILDIILSRQPFVQDAVKIVEVAIENQIPCYLTASNITDIFYLIKKSLSTSDAKKALSNLLLLFSILPVTEIECKQALLDKNPDYEDALLDACAQTAGIDFIVTRDKQFMSLYDLAISPQSLLSKFHDY